ncbi:MAG: hypothetical protein ACLFWB_00765 [Armatimonadota bacterium]
MKKALLIMAAGILVIAIVAGCDQPAALSAADTDGMQRFFRTPQTSPKVIIDIKPSSNPNPINMKSPGVVPVAVLTTPTFDAYDVIPQSIKFAGASPIRWTYEDVGVSPATPDGEPHPPDGDMDLLLFFNKQDLNLQKGQEWACITGVYKPNGYYISFQACDTVKVLGVK